MLIKLLEDNNIEIDNKIYTEDGFVLTYHSKTISTGYQDEYTILMRKLGELFLKCEDHYNVMSALIIKNIEELSKQIS